MNQRKCEPGGCAIQKVFLSHMQVRRHTTKIICTQRGWPTIKWNQDGAARAEVKYKLFQPLPLSKDTDAICLIRDTISF